MIITRLDKYTIASITRQRYRWPLDNPPVGFQHSHKKWRSSRQFLNMRKFLNTNYVFTSEGQKIRVV